MSSSAEVRVRLDEVGHRLQARTTIAVVGNPNAGKSALFNRLTDMNQKTANYPGVTVERRTGRCVVAGVAIDLVDLPGTYSLTPNSGDERISVSVLFGRVAGTPSPDGILAVIDSTRLYQGLYLLQQLVALGRPIVVALNMADVAERSGIRVDCERLGELLGGVPVVPVVATTGRGFDVLAVAMAGFSGLPAPQPITIWPELDGAVDAVLAEQGGCKRGSVILKT
jgi:ferrous iron transport protein B